MLRITAVLAFSLVVVGGAEAGSIFTTVGNYTTVDLTQASVGTCTGVGCTATYGAAGGYLNQTFSSTTPAVTAAPVSLTPSSSPQDPANMGVPFALNMNGSNKDEYFTANAPNTSSSVVVDFGTCSGVVASLSTCGIFNIANVYTMIQADGESYGYQGITVTLNGTSNGTAISDTISLTAGVDYRGFSSVATANPGGVDCTVASGGSGCANTQGTVTGTDTGPGGTAGNEVAVTNNVFGALTTGSNQYYLDVQELELPSSGLSSFIGGYLNSITITNASGSNTERMLLSGVTLQTAASTPEPGTIGLIGLGIASLGFLKMRRFKSSL